MFVLKYGESSLNKPFVVMSGRDSQMLVIFFSLSYLLGIQKQFVLKFDLIWRRNLCWWDYCGDFHGSFKVHLHALETA